MLLLSDIKGQDSAVRYLVRSYSAGRLAHSYLFSGQMGVGRASCAKAFIMTLFCGNKTDKGEACGTCSTCRNVDNLTHPDLLWIKNEENAAVKIGEVRAIKERLSLKPYEAPLNVCVVESAHMMTREASNAFLKMLEEPPANSLIILITHKKELLSQTVLSRCSEVRFIPLKMETAGEKNKQRRDEVISLIGDVIKEEKAYLLNWDRNNKDGLIEDIEMLIMFFRDITLGREGLREIILDKGIIDTDMYRFFSLYPASKLYGIVERLIEIKSALMGNVNPKLVAQVLPGSIK